MKRMRVLFIMLLTINMLCTVASASAKSIVLDGKFGDWGGMPALKDTMNDEKNDLDIQFIKWFPDNNTKTLFLNCERNQSAPDWQFEVQFKSDLGDRKAIVNNDSATGLTTVKLYDSSGSVVYSTSGNWQDSGKDPKQVEFSLPYEYLVGNMQWGYEMKMRFQSGTDYCPDSGFVTVSTISTYPYPFLVIALLLVLFLPFVIKKYRRKSA
ncbi:MAG: hypothetical protein H7Y41_03710 [Hyphomonadaceae bacterium]|nr:hypothetical protein [Clostridia bacterium]